MRVIFPLKVCCKYFTPLKCCTDLTLADICTKLSQFRIEPCKVKTVEIQGGFVHTNFSYCRNGTKVFFSLEKGKSFFSLSKRMDGTWNKSAKLISTFSKCAKRNSDLFRKRPIETFPFSPFFNNFHK